jgi:hypothetical protein
MKFILSVLFLFGHGAAAMYFSRGRLGLALGIVVGTWAVFLPLIALVKPSPRAAADGNAPVAAPGIEPPAQQVFGTEAVEKPFPAFPDIDDNEAATPDATESGTPTQVSNAAEPHHGQGSLF